MTKDLRIGFALNLLNTLEEKHIKYCVLRNYENMSEHIGHDIDMLIEKESDVDEIAKSIKEIGWNCKVEPLGDTFHTIICFNTAERISVLKIDLWTQFLWRGIPWIDSHKVIQSAQKVNNIYIPSPGAEAAVTVLKELVGGGNVPPKYYEKIKLGAINEETLFLNCVKNTLGNYGAELLKKCQSANFEEINEDKNRIKGILRNQNMGQFLVGSVKRLLNKVSKFFGKSGKLIVFVGPDGSGKSSIINGVTEIIESIDKPIVNYHIRYGIFPELKTGFGFSSMKGKLNEEPSKSKSEGKPVERSLLSKVASWVVVLYYATEFFVGKPIIWYHKARGRYVLYDRYFYDFFVQPTTRDLIDKHKNILMKCASKPDLIVHLSADPQIVYQRKKELSVKEIETQNTYMARILGDNPKLCRIINESKSIDAIVCEIFSRAPEIL